MALSAKRNATLIDFRVPRRARCADGEAEAGAGGGARRVRDRRGADSHPSRTGGRDTSDGLRGRTAGLAWPQVLERVPQWVPIIEAYLPGITQEMRGIAEGNLPRQIVLEKKVEPSGHFSRWTGFTVSGRQYKAFGEVTAWRASLWDEDELLAEQKSFLW